jgi:predicted kinase
MLPMVLAATDALLASPSLCYKPSMRKWMSERLKRRKKPAEKDATEAGPAPLQPKYFEGEASTAAPETEAHKPERREPEPVEPPPAEESPAVASPRTQSQPQAGADDPNRSRRRRRGRGGRGRGRSLASSSAPPRLSDGSASDAAGQSASPAAVPPVPSGTPKGVVVLAIGLPGSGKSAWFKRHNITPLSSDLLRALLFDDPTEQRFQDLVFSNLRSMLKARLIARRPLNYVDATNLTPQERHNWIKLAQDYGYEVQAVFFDVPVDVCLERNQRRERVVPEDVMRRMAAKLKAPSFEEGFAKITAVKVKKKDGEAPA